MLASRLRSSRAISNGPLCSAKANRSVRLLALLPSQSRIRSSASLAAPRASRFLALRLPFAAPLAAIAVAAAEAVPSSFGQLGLLTTPSSVQPIEWG